MTAILRVESRRRVRGTLVLILGFAFINALYFSMFPEFADDAEAIAEAFPEFMYDLFGIEAIHTIEGFIAAEVYSFFWMLLVAAYLAYVAAGTVAADIDSRRMDLLLANPVSRESVVLQKAAALWVPVAGVNVAVPVIVYVASVLIDEALNPVAVVMVHLLSIPYLLVCIGIGLVCSVLLGHARTARASAFGAVFLLWLVDGVSRLDPTVEWIGMVTPSRYYDVTAILVHEEYAYGDAALLVVVFTALVAVTVVVFVRRDI